MKNSTLIEVNVAMRGFSVLRRFDIAANEDCSHYDLTLVLSEKPGGSSRKIHVLFRGISELRSKEIGGGLTQLLLLKARALESSGLEGAVFEVSELERNSLSFKCESLELISSS